ncbi:MAG: hypothetical protein Q8P54_01990 [bacterium]|nr:hypothetical protein [bacterium]
MNKRVVELLGWYGVLAILGAYGMLSFGIITSSSLIYQILNLSGAFSIIIDTYYKKDVQPMVLNIFWAAIATFALIRIFWH